MPDSPVEVVFFDIDDTLVDAAAATRAGALGVFERYRDRLTGTDEHLMQRWNALLDHHFERYLRGETSFIVQRRARIRGLFGLTPSQMSDAEVDAVDAVERKSKKVARRLFPDAIETLDALGSYRLGVISNGSSAKQRQKLAEVGVPDCFAVVVISEDIGVAKPHPEIFEAACEAAGASPSACVHVGDRLEVDALGARDAGLTGVWLDRSGAGGAPASVPTISKLTELPALVRKR